MRGAYITLAFVLKNQNSKKKYRDFRACVLENIVWSCAPCRNATLFLFSFHIHTLTKEHTGRLAADNFFEPPPPLFCSVLLWGKGRDVIILGQKTPLLFSLPLRGGGNPVSPFGTKGETRKRGEGVNQYGDDKLDSDFCDGASAFGRTENGFPVLFSSGVHAISQRREGHRREKR